jgi:hypothetical protein
MTPARLLRWAGLLTVVGAALIFVSQVVGAFLVRDPATLAATAASPPFLVFALLKLAGFILLMPGLVSLYVRQSVAAGALGFVGFVTAFVGSALVLGDWWFEAFVVPWLARVAPTVVTTPADGTLLLGGVLSFSVFALGWLIFGAATFRARVFPRWVAALLMAGAVLAYGQGKPPLGALLAIALGVMSVVALRLDAGKHVGDSGAESAVPQPAVRAHRSAG